MSVNIKEDDIKEEDGRGKSATVHKEQEKGKMVMSPQQEKFINEFGPEVRFRVFQVFEVLQESHEEISIGRGDRVFHSCALNLKVLE
jgi:hypothetical protein